MTINNFEISELIGELHFLFLQLKRDYRLGRITKEEYNAKYLIGVREAVKNIEKIIPSIRAE